ncbi:MAG: hypothetical protein N3E45_17035, partial [Oscillatoriaceae bacterium SKW80]|nr:hypothetical protein [Oscillatoriaceae bacterium SKW80]
MKSAKFSTTLIVAGFLGTAATLVSLPAKAETVKITLKDVTNTNTQNYPTVEVTLDDAANPGSITATVKVVPGSTGYIGDLRGVFFNLPGVSNLQITPVSGGPLTNISTNGNFSKFSNSANLNGTGQSFNVGVEVGRQGIANGDDYQITTFKISGTDLKLSCFSESTIGVRLMSVGLPGSNRSLSSKTIGTVPTIVAGNSGGGSTGSSEQAGGGSTGSSEQAGGGSTGS